ncbi:MAG: PAS domain-containing protein, partial [Rudaea sp.]
MGDFGNNELQRLKARILQLEGENRELAASRSHLRAILDSEPACLKLLAADGSLLDMNAAGLGMLEADSLEQLRNHCVYPLIVEEHRAGFRDLVECALLGHSGSMEFEVIGLKGGRRWLETHSSPLRDDAGSVVAILGITQDIGLRKQATLELQAREHTLSESQRIAHIGSWKISGPQQRIEWTEETFRIYGLSPDGPAPDIAAFVDLIHPDDRPSMQAWIGACMAGGEPGELEFRSILPDGTLRYLLGRGERFLDADGGIAYLAGTVQDISERKRIDQELATSEQKFSTVFHANPAMLVLTTPDGKTVDLNRAYAEFI